ncbi:MAG TPA: T3SS effector HopA1 family protein [Jatrophihabitans sp.]|nr:T3SS effector HopA1 family protein [Jatrophihabitans sp.]
MPDPGQPGAVLAGGPGGATTPPFDAPGGGQGAARPGDVEPIGNQGSAASGFGGAAADPWPDWARPQLERAVEIAARVPLGDSVAVTLYRQWFNPVVSGADVLRPTRIRPLAGLYRSAHAGSSTRVSSGGFTLVERHDVVGVDGWWRTWGTSWTPPRTRPGSVRLMFSPRQDRLGEFVHAMTGALLRWPHPWTLACATSPRRVRRSAAAVLDVADVDQLPERLLDDLAPLLRPHVPPLCLPVAYGVGLASHPRSGRSFGEHRCHLIALALRHPSSQRDPVHAVAAVFAAHGIRATAPYRCG